MSEKPKRESGVAIRESFTDAAPNRNARTWWRTLEEHAQDPAFQARLYDEFPSEVEAITDPVARRTFLKLMGASLALAGVTACTRQPPERIVPYVRQPEEIVPGRPLYYATAMTLGGVATGVLVESHEGRPTKIEGNPLHPGSLGATDVFAQAAILGLYDPDRAMAVTHLGEIRPWAAFLGAIRAALTTQSPAKGAGLRLLTEAVCSPTLAAQIRELLARYPAARWHQWDPASRDTAYAGARLAFGEYVSTQYRLEQADVILALDADFLGCGAGSLRYAREFAARRRPEPADRMNRLYAIESMPTSTGSRADHRLVAKPSQVEAIARAIVAAVAGPAGSPGLTAAEQRWTAAVAKDLQGHRGRSLVIAGDSQPPAVHALAHAMNETLGNVGSTVVYTQPIEAEPADQMASLRELVDAMTGGSVALLVVLGGNPVYTAPADLNFAEAMNRVPLRVHLSQHNDETSELCHWHLPEAHFLETWSDARAYDGTVSIVQPLIAPLHGGRSAHDVLAAMSDRPERSSYDVVREFWNAGKDEAAWRRWLHDGVMADTAFAPKRISLSRAYVETGLNGTGQPPARPASGSIEIAFRNDPSVLDGRFANNGWLQELPKPITKLAWNNAIVVSPATAARINTETGPAYQGGEHGQIVSDVVELRQGGRAIRGPLFPVVGHPDDVATVHAGHGRRRGGSAAIGVGFDASPLRTAAARWFAPGAELVRTGERTSLACTQSHHLMEGRQPVRAVTREEYLRNPRAVREGDHTPPPTLTLYPPHRYDGSKWGMAIDLNTCIGCNACVVGCQAENNIPIVGRDQVLRGREMHWLRVDSYYRGEPDNPETFFQPVPCMHCENAPCEPVCPVGATVHSHEGLNDMVYNRCVGTRYCSNNCPYKVRRFNYFLYQDWDTPTLKLARNPDVTVRSRGVMEKCTYCVQRINAARIEAEKQDRSIRDGEIQTACQQACPADAIVFGDLNDPTSRVAGLQAEARSYALLGELNTRPRTMYLAAVRNVNPEIGES